MNADATPIAADTTRARLDEITYRIIGAAQRVSAELGPGFLEKVYENALAHELRNLGFECQQQYPIHVCYDGQIVGDYFTDILVEDCVVLEIKAASGLDRAHFSQCVHYLRATGLRVCLLLNFGRPHLELKRIVCNF